MICFYSFYFIMQGKLVILRTRCFLHQNTSQLQWFKEKTLFQSKFCRKLKSSISKVSKCGVHSVERLQKKRGGTAIIPTLWFWCEADVKGFRKSEEEQRSSQHQNQPPLKKRQMCWFMWENDIYCRRGR